MPNTVFIVYTSYKYEGGMILGVYSSKKLALQGLEKSGWQDSSAVKIAEVLVNRPLSILVG